MLTEFAATALAHPYTEHAHGWWWVGGVFKLLFLALLIFLVVRLVMWRKHRRHGPCGGPWSAGSAQSLLAERYAKGEIDATEYAERLRILHQPPPK